MKRALALIELIFAIVVIAIALTAVPNLISTTTKSSNSAITQEAISNAVSQMDTILSQYWDEVDTIPKYNNPVLNVDLQNPSLQELKDSNGNLLGRRVGSPLSTSRRYARDINGNILKATPNSLLGLDINDNNIPDDVDDFNNITTLLHNLENTSAVTGDYKDTKVKMSIKVSYIKDNPTNVSNYNSNQIDYDNPFALANRTNQSTNIKSITLQLTSTNDNNKKIIFRAFSCNIGSSKLKERRF